VRVNSGGGGHALGGGHGGREPEDVLVTAARAVTYGTGSVAVTHPGPVGLIIRTTAAGRAALRRKHTLTVSVHLAFRSSARLGSTSSSKDFRIKVRRGKH
jgi:hypothetical protein